MTRKTDLFLPCNLCFLLSVLIFGLFMPLLETVDSRELTRKQGTDSDQERHATIHEAAGCETGTLFMHHIISLVIVVLNPGVECHTNKLNFIIHPLESMGVLARPKQMTDF